MRRQQLRPRAPPRLLRAAAATTAQPCALPRPVSFVWRGRRQLSRAPCPAPSPSCGDDDDSSAARPALPRLLRVARTTTAQPCALPRLLRVARTTTAQPHALPRPISFVQRRRRQLSRASSPVSFVWRGRRQLSHTPCPAPSPSCSGGDDSSAARPAV